MKDKEQTISNLRKLKSFHNGSYGTDIDRAIKALEQEPKWIPVSERLPEKNGTYLAYIINQSDAECRYIMTCEYFVGDCHGWCPDDETASNNVVAWMPLPEEYKEKSEE